MPEGPGKGEALTVSCDASLLGSTPQVADHVEEVGQVLRQQDSQRLCPSSLLGQARDSSVASLPAETSLSPNVPKPFGCNVRGFLQEGIWMQHVLRHQEVKAFQLLLHTRTPSGRAASRPKATSRPLYRMPRAQPQISLVALVQLLRFGPALHQQHQGQRTGRCSECRLDETVHMALLHFLMVQLSNGEVDLSGAPNRIPVRACRRERNSRIRMGTLTCQEYLDS